MTTTTATAPTGPLELRSLDVADTLTALSEARRAVDLAEADLLALAVHLADLHPVGDGTPVAEDVPDGLAVRESEARPAGSGRPARPTAWMRELVIQRDGHCVFPG